MSYKFIFDTNVLDEESTAKLQDAGLTQACRSGRFAFYVTSVLLKERLHFITKGRIPSRAMKPLRLFIELEWQRLFNELGGPTGICKNELEGKDRADYLFMDYRVIKENLGLVLNGGQLTERDRKIIADDTVQWRTKKKKNQEAYKLMRKDINAELRRNKTITRKNANFKSFLDLNFEKTAISKIRDSINSSVDKDQLVDYWLKHKRGCPYFNKFIEGWLFTAWHFMAAEQEPKFDINAYEDIEHLIYLINLDGIISNEKGFIKTAAKALYPDKDFFTVNEFIARLKK